MCCRVEMCYSCLKEDSKGLTELIKCDFDEISYFEKLKICLQSDPVQSDLKLICRFCIEQLQTTYNFIKMIKKTQIQLKETFTDENDMSKSNEKTSSVFFDLNIKNETEYFSKKIQDDFEKIPIKIIETSFDYQISLDSGDRNETKTLQDFSCEFCEAIFEKRWQLQKHKQRNHLAEKKFNCPHCDKSFKQSYYLTEHIRSHTGEKIFECCFCGKKFHRLSSQKRHIKSHEAAPGEKTKKTPFLCTICGKSFPFSNGVQRHMRMHLGIKKHECNVCNMKFSQSTHLHVHMRTHTGEKPYICDVCGDSFSLKSSLQKHMNTHRKDDTK